MKTRTSDILFIAAIIFALWFAAAGWVWVYYANIIYALPFGIAALFIWLKLKKDGRKRNKVIPAILITGLLFSLGWLLYMILVKR
ncbi:MAG: hypothetical protein JST23_03295 [Bacteroidetes bacterium]|nr:hypothetical protein [Bacteroidota bacterium]